MARTMWMLRKGPLKAFFSECQDARNFRKNHPEFKHGKVTNVLQMQPSKIELGKIYEDGQ